MTKEFYVLCDGDFEFLARDKFEKMVFKKDTNCFENTSSETCIDFGKGFVLDWGQRYGFKIKPQGDFWYVEKTKDSEDLVKGLDGDEFGYYSNIVEEEETENKDEWEAE